MPVYQTLFNNAETALELYGNMGPNFTQLPGLPNGRMKCTVAGRYIVTCQLGIDTNGVLAYAELRMKVGSILRRAVSCNFSPGVAVGNQYLCGAWIYDFALNDIVTFHAFQTSYDSTDRMHLIGDEWSQCRPCAAKLP